MTAAKNATVGGDLNFGFRLLLKTAVNSKILCHPTIRAVSPLSFKLRSAGNSLRTQVFTQQPVKLQMFDGLEHAMFDSQLDHVFTSSVHAQLQLTVESLLK